MTRTVSVPWWFLFAALLLSCGGSNSPPFIVPVPDQEVTVGDVVSFTVNASDPDGEKLTFTADGLPNGATFDNATGEFRWPTTVADAGTHFLVVVAADGGSPRMKAAILVRMVVHDPLHDNHPPYWYGIPADGTAQVGVAFNATFGAVDPDADSISFAVRPALPTGATLEQSSDLATIHWTPQQADVGDYSFVVFAIDSGAPSMSVGYLYRITVSP